MLILGIHDGHNSGATLVKNGRVLASVCEERLTRSKNAIGYPRLSIDEVLAISGASSADIDHVAFASEFMHSADHLSKAAEWYRANKDDQARDIARDPAYPIGGDALHRGSKR